jgi:hypothetical protein
MGGTREHLSASQPVTPPGHRRPPATLATPDHFRGNSGLKLQEHSTPVLGLTFLRSAEVRVPAERAKLKKTGASSKRGSRVDGPAAELSIHGVEKTDEPGHLCRLNLAGHGLDGDICHGGNVNSYYDDPHEATDRFDFIVHDAPFACHVER